MSVESAIALVEKMRSDHLFAMQITEAEDKEERMLLAKSAGFTFTKDEMKKAKKQLPDSVLDGLVLSTSNSRFFVTCDGIERNCCCSSEGG